MEGIDPPSQLVKGMEQVLDPIRNLPDEERGTAYRGVAYGLVHAVLDMSQPAAKSAGSQKGEEQDQANQAAFDKAVAETTAWVNVTDFPDRKSDILLRIALDGGDGALTLNAIYQALCNQSYDSKFIDSHPELPMGKPVA